MLFLRQICIFDSDLQLLILIRALKKSSVMTHTTNWSQNANSSLFTLWGSRFQTVATVFDYSVFEKAFREKVLNMKVEQRCQG